MANPYAVNIATEVLEIFRGKEFGFEFDIGQSDDGPAEDLSDYTKAEFELAQGEGEASVVWSIETGHISLAGNVYSLHVSAAETAALKLGNFKWFASMGQGATSDEGIVRGSAKIGDAV